MVLIFYRTVLVDAGRDRYRRRHSTYEVNTDSRDVALGVGVVCESEQQTRLSDTRVADQEELEEVVVSVQEMCERRLKGFVIGTAATTVELLRGVATCGWIVLWSNKSVYRLQIDRRSREERRRHTTRGS